VEGLKSKDQEMKDSRGAAGYMAHLRSACAALVPPDVSTCSLSGTRSLCIRATGCFGIRSQSG